MNDWLTHLTAAGGRQVGDRDWQFPDESRRTQHGNAIAPLSHLGVLECDGPDAARFLQGQTSANVDHANGAFAPLTTFCTPKGRMLANAELLKVAEERYWLLLDASLVGPLATQLGKYAPFYKTTLRQRDDLVMLGVIGEPSSLVGIGELPGLDWHMNQRDDIVSVRHPGSRIRFIVIAPETRAISAWDMLAEDADATGNDLWQRADIDAGVAWLTADHSDAFLPQMINWEALGGISFRKGCYTGQEVVARAHFRGQVKKRLQIAALQGSAVPAIGDEIRDAEGKRVGEIFQATISDDGAHCDALAILNTSQNDESELFVGERRLSLRQLPYPLERLDPENAVTA